MKATRDTTGDVLRGVNSAVLPGATNVKTPPPVPPQPGPMPGNNGKKAA